MSKLGGCGRSCGPGGVVRVGLAAGGQLTVPAGHRRLLRDQEDAFEAVSVEGLGQCREDRTVGWGESRIGDLALEYPDLMP